jgi:hypothetical protein
VNETLEILKSHVNHVVIYRVGKNHFEKGKIIRVNDDGWYWVFLEDRPFPKKIAVEQLVGCECQNET